MQRRPMNISAALAIAIERQVDDIIANAKTQCALQYRAARRGAVAKRVEIGRRVFGRDDAIRSSGEVNGLIGWSLRQGLPSIDFTHGDLA